MVCFTAFNDGSVRDWQKHSIYAGKNSEASGSCDPWLVIADEIGDPGALQLTAWLNSAAAQQAQAFEMIFSMAEQIAYASQIMTLPPGDIIDTGSPEAVWRSLCPALEPW